MISIPLLSAIIFLPLFGSLIILLIKTNNQNFENNIKWASFLTSLGTFILSILLWLNFDSAIDGYQFEEKRKWFENFNFNYHVGIDGISLFFVLLIMLESKETLRIACPRLVKTDLPRTILEPA